MKGIKSHGLITYPVLFFSMLLATGSTVAQIFKCETNDGKIIYQDKGCNHSKSQQQLTVRKFDQAKIIRAQEKLNKELEQHKKLKIIQQELLLKEKKIKALESQVQSNEYIIDATRKNAEAIDKNTDSIKRSYHRSILNYSAPFISRFPYKKHRHKPHRTNKNR